MWVTLLKEYWQVSTFRRTPDETPYSKILLVLFSLFYLGLISLQWMTVEVQKPLILHRAVIVATLLILSYFLYTYVLLAVFRLSGRFIQALTTIFAGHSIVHLFAFPLLLMVPLLGQEQLPSVLGVIVAMLYLFISLLLAVWQFMLAVYIYKHALDVNYFAALLAGFGLLSVNVLVVSLGQT